jgi:hypothetical protein
MELGILEGLRGSEWGKGDSGEEKEGKGEAQGRDLRRKNKVSACNVAQCIYYAIEMGFSPDRYGRGPNTAEALTDGDRCKNRLARNSTG